MHKSLEAFVDSLTAPDRGRVRRLLDVADLNDTAVAFVDTRTASRLSGFSVLTLQRWVKEGAGKLMPVLPARGYHQYRVADIKRLVAEIQTNQPTNQRPHDGGPSILKGSKDA